VLLDNLFKGKKPDDDHSDKDIVRSQSYSMMTGLGEQRKDLRAQLTEKSMRNFLKKRNGQVARAIEDNLALMENMGRNPDYRVALQSVS
jgi:hypothetical protein